MRFLCTCDTIYIYTTVLLHNDCVRYLIGSQTEIPHRVGGEDYLAHRVPGMDVGGGDGTAVFD